MNFEERIKKLKARLAALKRLQSARNDQSIEEYARQFAEESQAKPASADASIEEYARQFESPEGPYPGGGAGNEGADSYRFSGDTISTEEYQRKYGTPQAVSPAKPQEFEHGLVPGADLRVIFGPTALNHEGHLRATGKICGHWAMYAYLLGGPEATYLGIQFKSGFRCYYPSLHEPEYHAIVNAESGSYWCWDNGIRPHGIPYIPF